MEKYNMFQTTNQDRIEMDLPYGSMATVWEGMAGSIGLGC